MKRLLCFVLCFTLLFACVVSSSGSAAAASDDELFRSISVLDYDMPGDGNISAVMLKSDTPYTYFDLPFTYGLLYFDIIIETRSAPSAVYIRGHTGNLFPLTFKHIEGYKYRCYGVPSNTVNSSRLGFQVDFSSDSFYVNFLKFDAYTVSDPAVDDLGEMWVTPDANLTPAWQTMGNPGESIGMNLYNWARDGYQDYEARFSCVNWRNFDYIDFKMELRVSTIKSIIAQVRSTNSSISIPFEISWLDGSAMSNNEFIANGEWVSDMQQDSADTTFVVTMRLFIPEYARSSGSLIISFNGEYPSTGSSSATILHNVTGYYITDVPDPQLTKLDQIRISIEQSLSSSSEDNATAESFQESMQSQSESIAQNQDTLNSVERPDASSVGEIASAGTVLDAGGMGLLVQMISPITHSQKYLAILTLVSALALVSYVFFGKKK